MFLFQRQELLINEKNCLCYVHVEVHEHLSFISNLRLVLPPIFSILICMQVETYNFNVVMLFLSLILCYGMVLKMINLRYHEVLTALSLSFCVARPNLNKSHFMSKSTTSYHLFSTKFRLLNQNSWCCNV